MMVIVLMLSTGEMVVGSLALEEDHAISIQDPFKFETRTDQDGYRTMLFYRYNQFAETSKIEFMRDKITSYYEANPDLSEYYFYSLDYAIKFKDEMISKDMQKACDYMQQLIDNNNKTIKDVVPTTSGGTGNTIH